MTRAQQSKPKMLFVDDRSKRIHAALRRYGDEYDVTIAPNVPEALRLLSSQTWRVVSLDADLDGNDFVDPASKFSGMEIVRYIQNANWPSERQAPSFIIHSSNQFVAELMYKSLYNWFMEDMGVQVHVPHGLLRKEPFQYEGDE